MPNRHQARLVSHRDDNSAELASLPAPYSDGGFILLDGAVNAGIHELSSDLVSTGVPWVSGNSLLLHNSYEICRNM